MSKDNTLEHRLKKIRKELSLIDKDLKTLSGTVADPSTASQKPRIRSKELREKELRRNEGKALRPESSGPVSPPGPRPASRRPVLQPQGTEPAKSDGRFVEYLSSSFHSGSPLGQERKIQRNKAVLMLVIVLLILFLVLYRIMI